MLLRCLMQTPDVQLPKNVDLCMYAAAAIMVNLCLCQF